MMQILGINEGDVVTVSIRDLPKGVFAKFKPKTIDFFQTISDIRTVLEILLKNYSTLTVGDAIPITYIDKEFYLEVVECKPQHAISIIETDIQVDFEQPEGYEEPKTEKQPEIEFDEIELLIENSDDEDSKPISFEGRGNILNAKKKPQQYNQPIEKVKKTEPKKKRQISSKGDIVYI